MIGLIACSILLFILINVAISLYVISEKLHKKDMEEIEKDGRISNIIHNGEC